MVKTWQGSPQRRSVEKETRDGVSVGSQAISEGLTGEFCWKAQQILLTLTINCADSS